MKSQKTHRVAYTSPFVRVVAGTAIFCVSLVISLSVLSYSSKTVHAGLVSFVEKVFGTEHAAAQIDYVKNIPYSPAPTSQTISLLQAAINRDPNPEKPTNLPPVASGVLIADLASQNAAGDLVNTQISTYVVQSGDTISNVAKMFGVSVNTILWANNLNSRSVLQKGQKLVILPISGITYTVKKGDTLSSIAKRYDADSGDILAYNDLADASALMVGDTIIIPNAEIKISIPTRTIAGSNPAHDTNGPSYAGYYTRPVIGGVRTQGLHGYNAVDLAAPVGTPIYAAASGVVIVSKSGGWNGGYGNLIIISHDNGTQTVYSHNSRNLVSAGDYVSQGQKIALMGMTGHATGPHVHFEIRGAKNPF